MFDGSHFHLEPDPEDIQPIPEVTPTMLDAVYLVMVLSGMMIAFTGLFVIALAALGKE
jgi:hypothetical protein